MPIYTVKKIYLYTETVEVEASRPNAKTTDSRE